MSSKSMTKTLHIENKCKYKRDRRWISWMDFNEWSLGFSVTSWVVIIKACSLDESLKQN